MAEDRRIDGVVLQVDGGPLPADLYPRLSSVRVTESVQLPDLFALRFDDAHFELFDSGRFSMGTRVDVSFQAEGELVMVTSGEVTAIAVEPGRAGGHELVVQGLDATHRLHRGPRTKSYVQVSDADIAEQVASDHGLESDIEATGEVHEYVLQASESDYAFLSRRARRIGYDVWITEGRLHFKKRPRASARPPVLCWGENLAAFRTRFSSTERCDEVRVLGWDATAKREIVGRASEGDPGCTAPAVAELSKDARSSFGDVSRLAGQFPVSTQAEADALASELMMRASGGEAVARGEAVGDPMIAAGAMVEVEGVGDRLAGRYRLTEVEHVFSVGSPYVTRFTSGQKEPASLVDLLRGNAGSASAVGGRGGWAGLAVAVVTNNVDPAGVGRVRVRFPTLSDQDESTWARLVTPGAGEERGIEFLPEVGDEVLVGFEHDDVRRPFVLGGLWNLEDPPPEGDVVVDGAVAQRRVTSRNGHRLVFVDDDPGQIELAMGDSEAHLSLADEQSTLRGVRRLRVEARDIEITADSTLKLRANKVEIAGDSNVKVTSSKIELN